MLLKKGEKAEEGKMLTEIIVVSGIVILVVMLVALLFALLVWFKFLSSVPYPRPSVFEFLKSAWKNGLQSELAFLESIKTKDVYARMVSLAFQYKRKTAIYN